MFLSFENEKCKLCKFKKLMVIACLIYVNTPKEDKIRTKVVTLQPIPNKYWEVNLTEPENH